MIIGKFFFPKSIVLEAFMFIKENFMLHTETANKLYHEVAASLPIIDYHCHLSPAQIAQNQPLRNAFELFLGGDHYKWRQLRTAGVPERLITGDAPDYDKFRAFAHVMPYLIGNPLYHWTHLELLRYFGIEKELSDATCDEIWHRCNEQLATPACLPQALISSSNVETLCTTDDPADTLEYHAQLKDFSTKVLPTFRPDKAVLIEKPTFVPYMKQIGIDSYPDLLRWLESRVAFFASMGCRLSDHSLESMAFEVGDAQAVFDAVLAGKSVTQTQIEIYHTALLQHCARLYRRHGFVMQLHIGAMRNNSTRRFRLLGADTGFDSLNDFAIAAPLSRLLDSLDVEDQLPKTILYTLNPKDNYVLGSMIGNFQDADPSANGVAKLQFGAGWWFNDQRDGMIAQMTALANLGMLSRFVGMLTDSRSLVSYPRHEYFRRIFCDLIGKWVEDGEYPNDFASLSEIVRGVCYENAKRYFQF